MYKKSEKHLIKQCLKGSLSAQKAVYDRFAPVLRGVCRRYISDPEEAKDVFQEGIIEVFKSFHSFKGDGSLKAWAKVIMRNTAIDYIRKNNKISIPLEQIPEVEEDIPESELYYMKLLDLPSFDQTLLSVLNSMPTILSSVFNMFYIDGLSHKEISDQLGIEEVTSRTRLNRARNMVMKSLKVLLKTESVPDGK